MPTKTIHYAILPKVSAIAGALDASGKDGAGVDTMGFNDAELVACVGAVSGTPDSFTVTAALEDSDDDGVEDAYAPVLVGTDPVVLSIIVANGVARVALPEVGSRKRYVRVVLDAAFVAGTLPTVEAASFFLLGQCHTEPVA